MHAAASEAWALAASDCVSNGVVDALDARPSDGIGGREACKGFRLREPCDASLPPVAWGIALGVLG